MIGTPAGIERGRSARQSRNFEKVTTLHEPSDTPSSGRMPRPETSSKMARLAIDGYVALLMATQAVAHIQIHDARRRGLLRHIAVARRALHSGANVRARD